MDRADPEGALSARRLFSARLPAPGEQVALGSDAAQHARVLRIAAGSTIALFDGRGGAATARVVSLDKRDLTCEGLTPIAQLPRPPRVVLVQCLPKAGKLDDIVRMTTELGVSAILLALSEHCVARAGDPRAQRAEHKLERLERIASEAARQSEQAYLPELAAPAPLREVLARAPRSAYKAACVERTATPLPDVVQADEVWLVIGPEGGLSARDRTELAAFDFAPVALGRSILRTETAAVVGVALALERLDRAR